MRRLPLTLGMTAIGFILLWVLFLAPGASSNVPSLSTTKGSLLHDPHGFLIILLDSLTYAGVLFIIASGFTLIFGLMRVVNMAHGAFFLLAAYIAAHFQKDFVGGGGGGGGLGGGLVPTQVSTGNWIFPVLIGTVIVAVGGLAMQQLFLRWNQGQELRQALITIAISIIIVDQLESPVGIGGDIAWPGKPNSFINLDGFFGLRVSYGWTLVIWAVILSSVLLLARGVVPYRRGPSRAGAFSLMRRPEWREAVWLVAGLVALLVVIDIVLSYWPRTRGWIPAGTDLQSIAGVQYSLFRIFMLGVAVAIGIGLWLWLQKTRIGMTIRAGVDDRAMVSALGINIQLVFAIAFLVGAALVGFGGGMGATQFGLQTHTTDAAWLVNSLIVVIIGGMGSLGGAAVGALLYAFVSDFSPVYLPTLTSAAGTENCCTEYSAILTFALVVAILAVRPLGLFGRPA